MSTETEYNLAINEAKRNLAVVQRELSEAIIERDKILNEVKDQRNARNIASFETLTKEEQKQSILEQLKVMEETLKHSRTHFENATDKEKEYLKSLERSIQEKQEQEAQFLGKTEELNILGKDIVNKQLELKCLKQEANKESETMEKHCKMIENEEIELNVRESELKEREKYIEEREIEIVNKRNELELKEKRLENLKQEILSKK